jgi:hypothetical protein
MVGGPATAGRRVLQVLRRPSANAERAGSGPVKRSAGWQDVTGMATQAQPALTGNRTAEWWPSKYGPQDEAGALNEITPAKVVEAVRLVRRGGCMTWRTCCTRTSPRFPGAPSGST